jgi:hypothetical protein
MSDELTMEVEQTTAVEQTIAVEQEQTAKYNLLEQCRKNSQKYLVATIFEENKGKWIKKREIEKIYSLKWSLRDIDDNIKLTKKELIERANYVPGDIQRDLRLFHDKFTKYGLEKKKIEGELVYRWLPINIDKLDDIIHPEARNIFKNEKEKDIFCKSKKYECEMCGASKYDNITLRIAIDHWRAHSTYNIDDKKIAVLLCERCNNIHHNTDASKIALKNIDNLSIIKKWVKKEIEIRSYGFIPNDDDREIQIKTMETITKYHKELGSELYKDFWEELF